MSSVARSISDRETAAGQGKQTNPTDQSLKHLGIMFCVLLSLKKPKFDDIIIVFSSYLFYNIKDKIFFLFSN